MKRRRRRVARHPGGEQARDDVPADVGAESGEHGRAGARMQGETELRRGHVGERPRGHDERRHADGLGVDAERELGHRRVAGERDLVDVAGLDLSLRAHLLGELLHRLAGQVAEAVERLGIEHRRRDAGDHVGAEGLLAVEHRPHRDRRARREVEQGGDDGRRPEIEGDRVQTPGRVPGLDVDEEIVGDDACHAEAGGAQHAREAAQHARAPRAGRGRPSRRAGARGRCADPRASARRAPRSASAATGAGSPGARRRRSPLSGG